LPSPYSSSEIDTNGNSPFVNSDLNNMSYLRDALPWTPLNLLAPPGAEGINSPAAWGANEPFAMRPPLLFVAEEGRVR
jgi:hypothetical protein